MQWLDHQRVARVHAGDLWVFLDRRYRGFLIFARVIGAPPPRSFAGDPKARATLGVSQERTYLLRGVAAGRSNNYYAVFWMPRE